MNRFLLAVAAILATTGTIREANAQDQEFRHVIVTLTSGEKVDLPVPLMPITPTLSPSLR